MKLIFSLVKYLFAGSQVRLLVGGYHFDLVVFDHFPTFFTLMGRRRYKGKTGTVFLRGPFGTSYSALPAPCGVVCGGSLFS